jgi:dihydroorotate dehydrogenase (NAD+) catalytic subunit
MNHIVFETAQRFQKLYNISMADYIDLDLSSPWMNAAGTLGFAPTAEGWSWPEMQGGFVTNPVSANVRTPAEMRAALPYPGGSLLHTGLPNPGLKSVLRKYAERWARSTLPVWVHLLANDPNEIHSMVLALEEVEGVTAVEIGILPGATSELALTLLEAAVGELAVVANLTLTSAGESWLRQLPRLGVSGISLTGPRGALPQNGKILNGRLVGPGLYPQALAALQALRGVDLPVVVGSGIYSAAAGRALLEAGAAAVQVDTALWL